MKNMITRIAHPACLLLFLFVCALAALAQGGDKTEATKAEEFSVASVQLIDVGTNHYVRVDLSHPFDSASAGTDLTPANVAIQFLPSGTAIPSGEIVSLTSISGFGDQTIQIKLTSPTVTKPAPNDKQVQVSFHTLHFKGGPTKPRPTKTDVTGTGPFYDATNINTLVNKTFKALQDAVANAKTPDEKNVFAGLNITVPSGKGGKTEGSGDIIFNRDLSNTPVGQRFFDQLNFGLKLNKASEINADPRHFEMGLQFRKVFLFNRAKIRAVRDALNGTPPNSPTLTSASKSFNLKSGNPSSDPVLLINDLQKDFFRSLLFDNAVRFEGDVKGASIGNVSNLLYDAQLQLTTVSRAVGGQAGFWNFRLIPAGLEAGYNLKNDDNKSNEKHSLARVKTGAVLELFYQANNPDDFLNRVEFNVQALDRYLFRRESAFDDTTKKAVLVEKGNKYWLQSDLKFMLGPKTQIGRVGFRASFRRGSLPPVYAFTKAFNFGIVFESGENDNSTEIKLK